MKIVISGGSGQVGLVLARAFVARPIFVLPHKESTPSSRRDRGSPFVCHTLQ